MTFPSQNFLSQILSSRQIIEDREPVNFAMEEVEYISINEKDLKLKGTIIKYRADKFGACLGLMDAKRFLEAQEKIPENLRDRMIFFFGTMVESKSGKQYFPFIWWLGGKWEISWASADRHWGNYPFVVPKVKTP